MQHSFNLHIKHVHAFTHQFNYYLYSAITTPRKVHKVLSIKQIKRQHCIKKLQVKANLSCYDKITNTTTKNKTNDHVLKAFLKRNVFNCDLKTLNTVMDHKVGP